MTCKACMRVCVFHKTVFEVRVRYMFGKALEDGLVFLKQLRIHYVLAGVRRVLYIHRLK